jgi:hypothetical protein
MPSTRALLRSKCRADTAETAAVRTSVMYRPSRIASATPVTGSSITIIAWWVSKPRPVFPAQTVTNFPPSAGSDGTYDGINPKSECSAPNSSNVRTGYSTRPAENSIRAPFHCLDQIGHSQPRAHLLFVEKSWGLRAKFQLTLVGGSVKVALRLGDEPIGTDRPSLESADANPVAATTGSDVGTGQSPVVNDATALNKEVVHPHFQVREGGHKVPGDLGDGIAPKSRIVVVSRAAIRSARRTRPRLRGPGYTRPRFSAVPYP